MAYCAFSPLCLMHLSNRVVNLDILGATQEGEQKK